MKLRDMMFLVIGGLLVISGMVLNTLRSGDAKFDFITCKFSIANLGSLLPEPKGAKQLILS